MEEIDMEGVKRARRRAGRALPAHELNVDTALRNVPDHVAKHLPARDRIHLYAVISPLVYHEKEGKRREVANACMPEFVRKWKETGQTFAEFSRDAEEDWGTFVKMRDGEFGFPPSKEPAHSGPFARGTVPGQPAYACAPACHPGDPRRLCGRARPAPLAAWCAMPADAEHLRLPSRHSSAP